MNLKATIILIFFSFRGISASALMSLQEQQIIAEVEQVSSNPAQLKRYFHDSLLLGSVTVARYILEKPIFDYDAQRQQTGALFRSASPFALATMLDQANALEMANLLLEHGLSIGSDSGAVYSVLKEALKADRFDEMVAKLDFKRFDQLVPFALKGDSSIDETFAEKLLSFGVDFGKITFDKGRNALMLLLDNRIFGLAQRILSQIENINVKDLHRMTALDRCININHEIKQLIIEAGSVYGSLQLVLKSDDKDALSMFLAAGGSPNEHTMIYQFLFNGRYEDVNLLIEAGADVNIPSMSFANLLAAVQSEINLQKEEAPKALQVILESLQR